MASLHPRVRLSQMKLSIVSLAAAAHEVEGAALPPSVLSDYLLDNGDEDREDEDEEEEQLEMYIRVVHLSFTSKYFDGHLICGAWDLPDPSLSFTSAIALSTTARVARDGRPG